MAIVSAAFCRLHNVCITNNVGRTGCIKQPSNLDSLKVWKVTLHVIAVFPFILHTTYLDFDLSKSGLYTKRSSAKAWPAALHSHKTLVLGARIRRSCVGVGDFPYGYKN